MIRQIESKVRAVRRRLRVLRFYRAAVWGASIATAIAALAFLVDKIFVFPWTAQEKWLGWGAMLAIGVLAAAVYAVASRLTLFQAALAADLRLGLQERFSSSVLLRDRADDPAISLLIADTHSRCAKLHPTHDFPFLLPRRYAHHVWPLVCLLAIHFLVPRMNTTASADAAQKPEEIVMPKEKRQEQAEKIEKMAQKVKENAEGELSDDVLKFASDLEKIAQELKTGEKNPKMALAEMSRINDEVRLERNELSKKFEGFQNLNTPLLGQDANDMQKALQRNEFDKAAEMAREMAMKAASDSSASDKEQLATELQSMAQQLAKDQPDMAKAMQDAAQAMQQAAQAQSKGDDAGMKEAMVQAQQAMEQAAKEMGSQAEAAQQMAQLDQLQQSMEKQKREMARSMGLEAPVGLGQKPSSDPNAEKGDNAGKTGEQVAQAQAGAQSGEQAGQQSGQTGDQSGQPGDQSGGESGQNSPSGQQGGDRQGGSQSGSESGQGNQPGGQSGGSEFANQSGSGRGQGAGTGQWAPGNTDAQGMGMGGPGQGRGGQAQFDDANKPTFVDTKLQGEKNAGEIIAVMNVDAPALKGESKIEYQKVFTEYRQKADDAISREDIPASLQPMVKDYFDAISPEVFEEATKQNQGSTPAKP